MLTVCTRSHPGTVRTINEDSAMWEPDVSLIAVADGMGGHNAGEVASRLAVDTVCEFHDRTEGDQDATWPFGLDPTLSFDGNRLVTAIKLANRRILEASVRENLNGMGTTVVAVRVTGDCLVFANAGDSRLYVFSGGRLEQLTRDDSWAAEVLAKNPGMTPEAIAKSPARNLLTNVVGGRDALTVACATRQLTAGEVLLLCSDGLHGVVPDALIAETLAGQGDAAAMADRLVRLAMERGTRDNITAVVVCFAD
jgi:serine/threonine protein phosphatase PrpC